MKKSVLGLVIFGFVFFESQIIAGYKKKMVVCVPVADLRARPESVPSGIQAPALSKDIHGQKSQLLYGEHLLAEEVTSHPEWLKVEALEQQKFQENRWSGYSGYIKKNQALCVNNFPKYDAFVKGQWINIYREKSEQSPVVMRLSVGTSLQVATEGSEWTSVQFFDDKNYYVKTNEINIGSIAEKASLSELRRSIVDGSKQFLGSPYVWGGSSAYDKENQDSITSVDCSGLVYLVYKSHGIVVPRDSHDQFLKSRPVLHGSNLKPGDLLFFSRPCQTMKMLDRLDVSKDEKVARAIRMCHVLMYIGDGKLIEAMGGQDVLEVRIVSDQKRLGRSIKEISHSQRCKNGIVVFFGTFFDEKSESSASIVNACMPQKTEKYYRDDELVNIVEISPGIQIDLMYAGSNNVAGTALYDASSCFVRYSVARRLDQAQKELEMYGLSLLIKDGYRPISAQHALWNAFPVDGLVAPPPPGRGSNHCRGTAVDVALVRLSDGKELDMGCPVDELSARASRSYSTCLSDEQCNNRELLEGVMIKYGFNPLPAEWWHFNDDKAASFCKQLDVSLSELEKRTCFD